MSTRSEGWARWWPRLAIASVLLILASSPWWGTAIVRRLAYFRVRKIEVVGTRYLAPSEVLARLRADTTMSIWDDPTPLEARVARHPQVHTVTIERRLPSTLVVHVDEVIPVALAPGTGGLRAFDVRGRELPFDPSRTGVDLPIANRRDTALFRLLDDLRRTRPALYARVSDVQRTVGREVLLRVSSLTVRAMLDVTADRLAEIFPVEADLARRQARVAELDLRFRDQVIARLP